MKRPGRGSAGVTLIELMIGLAVGSILLVVTSSLLQRVSAFHRVEEQVGVLETARQGFFLIAEEIRNARDYAAPSVTFSSMTLSVYEYNPDQAIVAASTVTVRYRFEPQTRYNGVILREVLDSAGGVLSARVMLRDVKPPSQGSPLFKDLGQRSIRLQAVIQSRDVTQTLLLLGARTLKTEIFLRNPPPQGP